MVREQLDLINNDFGGDGFLKKKRFYDEDDFLKNNGIDTKILHWPLEKKEPNVMSYLKERKIDLVINIPKSYEEEELTNDYLIRRRAVDYNIPLLTNPQNSKLFIESISKLKMEDLKIKEWEAYD